MQVAACNRLGSTCSRHACTALHSCWLQTLRHGPNLLWQSHGLPLQTWRLQVLWQHFCALWP